MKASRLFVLFYGIFEGAELNMKQAVFSNVLVHKNRNSRDAMWKVPVLFTTWHLWIFSSVKSEIQQNTNGLLTVSRISSTIFRMATFVHSFDLNYV